MNPLPQSSAGRWRDSGPLWRRSGRSLSEVERQGLRPPSILLFGRVAARREEIAWLERRPLHGKRVVVTRARAQASGMARTLEALGAEVIELPAIRIVPTIDSDEVRAAVESLHTYALVCVTSPNGARLLFEAMEDAGRDARALSQAQVAAIGPGTARALREHGVIADVVPERFVAEALVEALAEVPIEGKPVLVARAAEARDVLPDALRERGAEVDVVALYETVRETPAVGGDRGGGGRGLRDVHLVVDGEELPRGDGRPRPRGRARSSRSAR